MNKIDFLNELYYYLGPLPKKEKEEIIADFLAKEVEVNIISTRSKQDFRENYVDLGQLIHMDIEEED